MRRSSLCSGPLKPSRVSRLLARYFSFSESASSLRNTRLAAFACRSTASRSATYACRRAGSRSSGGRLEGELSFPETAALQRSRRKALREPGFEIGRGSALPSAAPPAAGRCTGRRFASSGGGCAGCCTACAASSSAAGTVQSSTGKLSSIPVGSESGPSGSVSVAGRFHFGIRRVRQPTPFHQHRP